MAKFSKISLERLRTVHADLETLFKKVVEDFDCSVISGFRTTEEQQGLYAKGRTEPGNIITYKDGVNKRSKHQEGLAVDVVPYPSLYSDEDKLIEFGGYVLGVAKMLKEEGKINSKIEWGGHWKWKDRPHFQIRS